MKKNNPPSTRLQSIEIIPRKGKIDFWRESVSERVFGLAPLGIDEIIMVSVSSRHRAEPPIKRAHVHGNLEICTLTSGMRTNYSNGDIWYLSEGDLWINKPNTPHGSALSPCGASTIYYLEVRPPRPAEHYLGLPPEEAAAFWQAWLDLPVTVSRGTPFQAKLFSELIRLVEFPETQWPAFQARATFQAFLFSVLGHLRAASERTIHPGIKHILGELNDLPPDAEIPTLHELADRADLSLSHFKACFKRDIGTSPAKYLLFKRLTSAAAILAATDDTIVDISLRFGFASPQHFAYVFKGYFGETPTRHRELSQAQKKTTH